jgi:hypothetical protein
MPGLKTQLNRAVVFAPSGYAGENRARDLALFVGITSMRFLHRVAPGGNSKGKNPAQADRVLNLKMAAAVGLEPTTR